MPCEKYSLKGGGAWFKHLKLSYFLFYEEFYKNFLKMNKEPHTGLVKDSAILAGLFLQLTFENLITATIREVVDSVYRKVQPNIERTWKNIFETEKLEKKIDFLENMILKESSECSEKVRKIKQFIHERLNPLRNKIVHGHEISLENGKIKSQLLELLSDENINRLYEEFWQNLRLFLGLFDNLVFPQGREPNLELISRIKEIEKLLKEKEEKIKIGFKNSKKF